jgi:hypothetical protein
MGNDKENNHRRNDYWRTIIFVSAVLEIGNKQKPAAVSGLFHFQQAVQRVGRNEMHATIFTWTNLRKT